MQLVIVILQIISDRQGGTMKNSITFRLNPKHAEDREIMEWLDENAAEEGGQTALVKSALLSVIHGIKKRTIIRKCNMKFRRRYQKKMKYFRIL